MLDKVLLIAVAALFLVMGCFLWAGKGSWLIAGYNTMAKSEKAKWNGKALCRAVGVYMFALAALALLMLLMDRYPWIPYVFTVGVVGGSIFLLVYVNTSGRFKRGG